jgi:putative thioredoxin
MLAPILEKLAQQLRGGFTLAKVNTDDDQRLAREYGVSALPTVKVFKAGRVVDEFTGVLPESAVRAFVERHMERESDKLRHQAETALEEGDDEEAQRLIKAAADMDPENAAIRVATAKILMHNGQIKQAGSILSNLPVDIAVNTEVKRLQAQLGFAQTAARGPTATQLERTVRDDPGDLQARHRLSAQRVMRGDYEGALEQLIEIMRRDRDFGDDAGRKEILAVFEILGGSGDLVSRYRAKMINMLH